VRIAGGLVLLIAALNTIFRKPQTEQAKPGANATQLAASPLAIPAIVPPAGVAAILIFIMLAQENPRMWTAIGIALTVMMILDFLVMYFIDFVLLTPGLMLALQVVGATLIFMQVCIGIEIILRALKDMGVVPLRAA
jgi:multiple antibiotic resistance protein